MPTGTFDFSQAVVLVAQRKLKKVPSKLTNGVSDRVRVRSGIQHRSTGLTSTRVHPIRWQITACD